MILYMRYITAYSHHRQFQQCLLSCTFSDTCRSAAAQAASSKYIYAEIHSLWCANANAATSETMSARQGLHYQMT